MGAFARLLFLLAATPAVHGLSLRKSRKGPLDTPSQIGYEPEDLLCKLGKKTQGWCMDWIACIRDKASGQASKVKEAWGPADCEEYCGKYPVTSPLEGQEKLFLVQLFGKKATTSMKDCMTSCENFQENLVNCVGTIMYEPGQLAVMGPKKNAIPPPEHCSGKATPCMPDLPIKYQTCHSDEARKTLTGKAPEGFDEAKCKMIKRDYNDCKQCPQLNEAGGTAYATFVGGCMDQLNAYWQATHPSAGVHALPGASSCPVHD